MKNQTIKISILIVVITFMIQSCSKDDDTFETNDDTLVETNNMTQLIGEWNPLWLDLDRATNGMRPNATARLEDNEDLWIAEFWSDDVENLMMSPLGRQFSIATQLVEQEDLKYEQTLALYLKLGFAMNDGVVSAWADKYTYNTERPSTYIQEYINQDYVTNLSRLVTVPNPSFPTYSSRHATFTGAAAGVFIDQFGSDSMNFTDRSHQGRVEFRGALRSYDSFSEMAKENGYLRVPLGVHVQADSDEGLRLGYEVSDAINAFNIGN